MDDAAYVHLEVALEVDCGDTIRGTVGDRGGPALAFTGWLELMSAFDSARTGASGADAAAAAADSDGGGG